MNIDRVMGQALETVFPAHLAAQNRAYSSIRVLNGKVDLHLLAALKSRSGQLKKPMVESLLQTVVLAARMIDIHIQVRAVNKVREIDMFGFPMLNVGPGLAALGLANHLVHGPITQLRHQFANFLGHEHEITNHVFGGPLEALPQVLALGRDAHWARIQVTNPHQ